jgi:hypothetical protein
MDDAGFLPKVVVERFMSFARPDLRDIGFELRNLVFSVRPRATEFILWGGLSNHDASKGGPVKGAICQITVEREHVQIASCTASGSSTQPRCSKGTA